MHLVDWEFINWEVNKYRVMFDSHWK